MSKRQTAFLIGKILFAAAVITLICRKVDLSHVWISIRDAQRLPILLGILLSLGTVVVSGWRWQRLLRAFQSTVPLWPLICIAQIGQFFVMFLPGPTGDDLTRMLYISRLAPGRVAEACTTVLLDRCIGLASVLLLAALCIPWQWSVLATSPQTHWLALAIVIAGGGAWLCGILFLIAGHPTQQWFEKRLRSLPAHSWSDEITRIWGLLCANKATLARVIAAAIVTQLLICLLFYLAGFAVGIRMPFLVWLSFLPILLASAALPITVAGFGVREYLLVLFLGVLGQVDSEHALAASFVVFAMTLTVCLLVGILYIFYRPKQAGPETCSKRLIVS